MSVRKPLAVAILAVWVGTLAWNAKRLYLRPEAERLAEAATTLPPGPAYYSVWREDRRVGWARSELDTIPSRDEFLLRDQLVIDLGALGLGGEARVRTRALLGPSLDLRRFSVEASGLLAQLSADGIVAGDSALRLTVSRGGESSSYDVPLQGPVILSNALPLRLAARGEATPGERFEVRTFDPMELASKTVRVEVLDRTLRSYPDSAVLDSVDGRWRAVREDTVRAWLVSQELAGISVESWVSANGRLLEARTPSGFRLERTAFELAFWPFERRGGRR